MSPRFESDLTGVTSALVVLKPGDYEFKVGDPKSFKRQAGEDKHDSIGIRYPLQVAEVVEGDVNAKGKKILYSLYLHSDGAKTFAKQFVMACLGFENKEASEEKFNDVVRGKDWSYDPETQSVGEVWASLRGTRVIGTVDIGVNNKDGTPMQQFKGFRPLNASNGA